MGRIAQRVDEHAKNEDEYSKICAELSEFWNSGDESKLSPKAKKIWLEWKRENKKHFKVNKDLVNEWEGV